MNQSHRKQDKLFILLTLSGILTFWVSTTKNSLLLAQITPDNTLNSEKSVVTPGTMNDLPADIIEGGAERGNNLFHSFSEFNVNQGQQVYFNDRGFSHIFSRVTGNNLSNILGTLGVLGNADLFLLNPNGIIFGQDASLDVNGSFLATSADSLIFDNNFAFSASNPQAPPLLTVNVPLGLQYGVEPGMITNRSQAGSNFFGLPAGLEVKQNQTLALVGGNLELEAGNLTAQAGRIELGSVGDNSFVRLASTNPGWQLAYGEVQEFDDILLSQGAIVLNISNEQAGEIQIQGRNITLKDGTQIVSANIGTEAGGKIKVSAAEEILLSGRSNDNIDSTSLLTFTAASGAAGDINVTTSKLTIENGAEILSFDSFSPTELSPDEAGTGNITINASESVTVKGVSSNQQSSQLATQSSVGNGGIVQINTERLKILDGGQVGTVTFGRGQGGTIEVNATTAIEVKGIGGILEGIPIRSALLSRSQPSSPSENSVATGKAGDISIKTRNLLVQNGAEISTATLSAGKSGNLFVEASESVSILGNSNNEEARSRLVATTAGRGEAGSIEIETGKLILQDGGAILATTFSEGKGGSIDINATESIEISGTSTNDKFNSTINAGTLIDDDTDEMSTGDAGNISITTESLSIRSGANIAATTFGEGKGGELTVKAKSIELIGTGEELIQGNISTIPSAIFARTRGSGNADTVTINAENLTVRDGASVAVSSTSEASGNAGDLNIFTKDLLVANQGEINVSAEGTGEAGSLNIDAQDVTLDKGSLTAETRRGDQGNITLSNADSLLLRNNSQITTNALESATGGDITITSDVIALLDNSKITATAVRGRGGNIQITTQGLFQDPDSEITATSELGIDGTITINDPDVDPTSGLVKLPDVPIDTEAILAQNLCKFEDEKIAKGSSFIITGRGGLTPTSAEPLGNLDRVV